MLRSLDPKLVVVVVTAALTRGVLAIGGDPVGDPLWNALIALIVASVAGYLTPNDGTVLRTEQEDGNPILPEAELNDSSPPKRKPTTRKKAA